MKILSGVIGVIGAIVTLIVMLTLIAAIASNVQVANTGIATNYTGNGTGTALASPLFSGGNAIVMIVLIVVFFLMALATAWSVLKSGK